MTEDTAVKIIRDPDLFSIAVWSRMRTSVDAVDRLYGHVILIEEILSPLLDQLVR